MRMLAAALLASMAGTATAQAQRSVVEELRLNVHATGVSLGHGEGDVGVGPAFSIGYGASRWFIPFFTYDRTSLNDGELDYALRHMDAGVRTHLRGADAALVPFVLAAFTWRSAEYEDRLFLGEVRDVKIAGTNPTLGAGALYYLHRRFAVETALSWTLGDMSQITAEGLHFTLDEETIDAASLRLELGLSWFPIGPRNARRRE